ncbi:MAG TPA: ATP-binding protein [Planctomycetota bacterium]|nr:ATP-binding protein [Planctomycetota bacterium]
MKAPRFCSTCGFELPPQFEGQPPLEHCPRCDAPARRRPSVGGAGIVIRDGERGPEILLVRRAPLVRFGAGRWCIPCGYVEWGEDVRDAVRREVREETGLDVEVLDAYDVHSNFHDPERQTAGCWFRARPTDTTAEPVPGDDVDRVEFFPLDALPDELAFPTDERVLARLKRELKGGEKERIVEELEATRSDLERRLDRRRENYRGLLELYTNELMRGAWVNELLLGLSKADETRAIAAQAAQHLATQRDVDGVRVWLPGPPDRCEVCPWAAQCSRERCLHLVARANKHDTPEESTPPDDEVRVPFIRGLPAADTSFKNTIHSAELPGAGARPGRFEGFPLEIGPASTGALGLISQAPLDQNARRLFEIVARHVAALVRNAKLVADLQSANKAKSAFIARMSHELKTPLTAILGFAELLREERTAAGDDMGADGASTIEQSGRQLLGIVESILEIAKLESGAITMAPQRVDVGALARAAVERHLPRATSSQLELVFENPPPRGGAIAWCDPARVERILDELLLNALKFTKQGKITISCRSNDDEVLLDVKDTGIGIAPEQRDRIFEAFTQADESIHLEYGGLGIGLAIAKTLVTLMGGRIWVDSVPGQGSRFSIALPKTARA